MALPLARPKHHQQDATADRVLDALRSVWLVAWGIRVPVLVGLAWLRFGWVGVLLATVCVADGRGVWRHEAMHWKAQRIRATWDRTALDVGLAAKGRCPRIRRIVQAPTGLAITMRPRGGEHEGQFRYATQGLELAWRAMSIDLRRIERGRVRFDVTYRNEIAYPIAYPEALAPWDAKTVPFGVDVQGRPVTMPLWNSHLLIAGLTGSGKALDCDTLIPTPRGWVRMGDLAPGMQVFGRNGEPTDVLAVSEIMDDRPCYRLRFDDGSEIVADAEHQWLTFTAAERQQVTARTDEFRAARRAKRASEYGPAGWRTPPPPCPTKPTQEGSVRTTREIAATVRRENLNQRANHSVPVCAPIACPDAHLPLDPYVLGAWLGDGTTKNAGFTCHEDDVETIDRIRLAGWTVTKSPGPFHWNIGDVTWRKSNRLRLVRANTFVDALARTGVLGNKHIPERYLWASEKQRLALLQGLMDTDGTISAAGAADFTTTCRALADGVAHLVRSLGMKTTIRESRATLYGRDCGPKWRVQFTPTMPVFRLARKAVRVPAQTRSTQRQRYIVGCEPVESRPVRCIKVSAGDQLFLAGESMIPTHNSGTLHVVMAGIAPLDHTALVLCDPKRVELQHWQDRASVVATDLAAIDHVLARTLALVRHRFVDMERHRLRVLVPDEHHPHVVVIVDELALIVNGGTDKAAKQREAWMIELAATARAAAVTLVLATQRPAAVTIPTQVRDQIPRRIAHATANQDHSRMILGDNPEPAHLLSLATPGVAYIAVDGQRRAELARAYWIDDTRIETVAEKYAHLRVDPGVIGLG